MNSKPTGETSTTQPALIRQLRIERFRGIENLKWNPTPGLNIILGGGDVGKTTILEAIALLLSPTNNITISEADYLNRETALGFKISAVVSLPSASEVSQQQKFSWPWEWTGSEAVVPMSLDSDDDLPAPKDPVYCLHVRGTSELELVWEILQPNDQADPLSTAVRKNVGVVRLSGDDRNDRDLRLVFGSALDRLLDDQGLRARIAKQVAEIDLDASLSLDAKTALSSLEDALAKNALPSGLELGLTSSQGISIGALIGLLAEKKKDLRLPLSSWGAGTRRMATLEIAAATQSKSRISIIDEVERGLEPYRVRKLISSLQSQQTQTFVTTHSPIAIKSASKACLWYLDAVGAIGELSHAKIEEQQRRDPETFLSRLAVIAEGPTEVGFALHLLRKAVKGDLLDHGIRVCDGQGTPATLGLLEAMGTGGLKIAAFADGGEAEPGRWKVVKARMGDYLFQWSRGSTEENVFAMVSDDKLVELIKNSDGVPDPERRKTLAERLSIHDSSIEAIVAKTENAATLRALMIAAATGSRDGAPTPDIGKTWKKHGQKWFKSCEGGDELAEKVMQLGLWPQLKPLFMPFLNAVRSFVGQPSTTDINP